MNVPSSEPNGIRTLIYLSVLARATNNIQQTYELWFKQLLHESGAVIHKLRSVAADLVWLVPALALDWLISAVAESSFGVARVSTAFVISSSWEAPREARWRWWLWLSCEPVAC